MCGSPTAPLQLRDTIGNHWIETMKFVVDRIKPLELALRPPCPGSLVISATRQFVTTQILDIHKSVWSFQGSHVIVWIIAIEGRSFSDMAQVRREDPRFNI